MKPHLLYIIGPPGAGKSTLVQELKRGHSQSVSMRPFAHTYIHVESDPEYVVELGRDRDSFSGTDSLSMSVLPKVLSQAEMEPWPLILGEGDRLATMKFFEPMRSYGYKVDVVYLNPPAEVLSRWRSKRVKQLGKAQDESWVAGRTTKNARLAEACGATVIDSGDMDVRLDSLARIGSPVVNALLNGRMKSAA